MNNKSFAEVAMELSGKSKEEAQSIGKIDTADDQVKIYLMNVIVLHIVLSTGRFGIVIFL